MSQVELFDKRTLTCVATCPIVTHEFSANDLVFTDSSQIVVATSENCGRVLDIRMNRWVCEFSGHRDWVYGVDVHNNTVALCSGDSRISLWDLCTGTQLHRVNTRSQSLQVIRIDDHKILHGGTSNRVSIVRPRDMLVTRNYRSHTGWVRCLDYDWRTLVSGGEDMKLLVHEFM